MGKHVGIIALSLVLSWGVALWSPAWVVFWPSLLALILVFVLRSALLGLLVGAVSGALILSEGHIWDAGEQLVMSQFAPIFSSSWKLSAMLFTLILGGFVGLIEASGGLQSLVRRFLGEGTAPAKRMQMSVVGMGFLVFFDGLANTMLIGRLLRSAADRCGVSREKLAYLADATGSAIACLAFVSTWIAFQLSMIREGYVISGQELGSAYALFFKSLPTNFYCWFTLVLLFVSVGMEYNPGPMGAVERSARTQTKLDNSDESEGNGHWLWAIGPILMLTLSVPVLAYCIGVEQVWPFSLEKFASAYGAAEKHVPLILVASSVLASMVAALACLISKRRNVGRVFLGGCRELLGPVAILIAAWMLGSVISQLGAAELLSHLLDERLPLELLPLAIFVVGALVSFSTGTSWGTMGVLMPLAIPVVFGLSGDLLPAEQEHIVVAVIGAVFSGAVFGDHCSPFSDTTIVASIASGVEPMDHVRTQLPFALIAALVAGLCGFLPYGYGLPAWIGLVGGSIVLLMIAWISISKGRTVAA
jgi:Na+/H+ antiporter